MIKDAKDCFGFLTPLPEPRVGCLIIIGGKASGAPRPIGHVGIVSFVSITGAPTKVIHCSAGNHRRSNGKKAIQETGPEVFMVPDVVYAWYEGIEY
jgi:hypothetical protein